jgi:Predicted O-linked N-acetylglucosamine transferase, SPINDLY family
MKSVRLSELLSKATRALQRRNYETAEKSFREILRFVPGQPEASLGLADLALLAREPQAALDLLAAAAARFPDHPRLLATLARGLHESGRGAEALPWLERLARLEPRRPEHRVNRGHLLARLGRHAEAAVAFGEALALAPHDVEPRRHRALSLAAARQRVAAAEELGRLQAAKTDTPADANLRVELLRQIGRMDDARAALAAAIARHPADARLRSTEMVLRLYDERETPASLLAAARTWGESVRPPRVTLPPPLPGLPPERRLRLGYYAADWAERALNVFTRHLIEHHDRARVEVFVYQDEARTDALTTRFKSWAEHWRELWQKDEDAAARAIAADRLDVLIDLNAHFSNPRPSLVARKPAPRIVHYLDFPATTGNPAVDARLADTFLEPPQENGAWSTEALLHLPGPCLVFRGHTKSLDPGPLPAAAPGSPLTFGSANNLAKITPTTLRLWAAVLAAVPDSRLLLVREELAEDAVAADWRARLEAAGLPVARIDFLDGGVDFLALEHFRRIDVMLDTAPYNGITTTLDALWMGVPVVTMRGDWWGARASAAILCHLDLAEWIAASADDYARIAARLAADRAALAHLRATLRDRLLASPLADAAGTVRAIEDRLIAWLRENPPGPSLAREGGVGTMQF